MLHVFSDQASVPDRVVDRDKDFLSQYQEANVAKSRFSRSGPTLWTPPPLGVFKVNVDVAVIRSLKLQVRHGYQGLPWSVHCDMIAAASTLSSSNRDGSPCCSK